MTRSEKQTAINGTTSSSAWLRTITSLNFPTVQLTRRRSQAVRYTAHSARRNKKDESTIPPDTSIYPKFPHGTTGTENTDEQSNCRHTGNICPIQGYVTPETIKQRAKDKTHSGIDLRQKPLSVSQKTCKADSGNTRREPCHSVRTSQCCCTVSLFGPRLGRRVHVHVPRGRRESLRRPIRRPR